MEQLDYNLLCRWIVGRPMDAAIWDVTEFTKNRERLIDGDVATKFMAAVLRQPRVTSLSSDDHFSVDGTLIEAWASMIRTEYGTHSDATLDEILRLYRTWLRARAPTAPERTWHGSTSATTGLKKPNS